VSQERGGWVKEYTYRGKISNYITVLDKHKVTTEELIKHCSGLQLALTLD
jgi:hypothetical protein